MMGNYKINLPSFYSVWTYYEGGGGGETRGTINLITKAGGWRRRNTGEVISFY